MNRDTEFIESQVFSRQLEKYLDDDQYQAMQASLILNPSQGDVIRNSGGIRKTRWKRPGKGKCGGLRVLYYLITEENSIYLLYLYPKSEQEDLKPAQLAMLKKLMEEE